MKFRSKINITMIATLSILLLISVSFILCNPSVAHYKTRITVDTVNLEITPYQPVVEVSEDTPTQETIEEENQTTENLEETN